MGPGARLDVRRGCVWSRCVPRLLRRRAAGRLCGRGVLLLRGLLLHLSGRELLVLLPQERREALLRVRRKERARCSNELQTAADQRLIGFQLQSLGLWIDPGACQESRGAIPQVFFNNSNILEFSWGQSWSDALRG